MISGTTEQIDQAIDASYFATSWSFYLWFAVAIHRSEQELTCTACLCFLRPLDNFSSRRYSAVRDKRFSFGYVCAVYSVSIDRADHGLCAEALADCCNQVRIGWRLTLCGSSCAMAGHMPLKN
jgi:hypothetical protein